jgi:hypothetical protein
MLTWEQKQKLNCLKLSHSLRQLVPVTRSLEQTSTLKLKETIMAKTQSTEVAVEKNTQLAIVQSFSDDELYKHAGSGLENVRSSDVSIPYISILQPLSPQVQPKSDSFISDAKQGMLYNNVTKEIYPENGLRFIQCGFVKKYIEWTPRGTAGASKAPIAEYTMDDPISKTATKNDRGQLLLPNGNQLVETANHFGLFVKEDGTSIRACMSLDSTDLSASRALLTMMTSQRGFLPDGRDFTLPSWIQIYNVVPEFKQNESGMWYKFGFAFAKNIKGEVSVIEKSLVQQAKSFAELISQGLVKVELNTADVAQVQSDPKVNDAVANAI